MPKIVTIVDHPLVRHKLSLMRAADTSTSKFRQLMREISLLLGYEATRDLALEETLIETPLERARMPVLAGRNCASSILRGSGILDGMLDLVPAARAGHVGLYREPPTRRRSGYLKLPDVCPARRDPARPDAGDRQLGGGGDFAPCRGAGARSSLSAWSPRKASKHPPFPGLRRDCRDRPRPQRPRLYPAWATGDAGDGRSAPHPAARQAVLPDDRSDGRGRSQDARCSCAIATNLLRCAGESARNLRSRRSFHAKPRRFSAASSNNRERASAWLRDLPQADPINGATCWRIFSVRARITRQTRQTGPLLGSRSSSPAIC